MKLIRFWISYFGLLVLYLYKKQFSKDQGPKMNINLEYTHVRNEKNNFLKNKIKGKHL
jgi:hypothetical protein